MGTIIRHTRLEAEPNGSRFIFRDLIEVVEEAKRQSVPERADVSLISGGPLYGMAHSERGVMSTTWGPTAIPPVCRRIAPMQLSHWRNGRVFATAM